MTTHNYKNNRLHLEQVSIATVARDIPTPFYIYSQYQIENKYQQYCDGLKDIDHLICYALKANSNQAIIKILADLGAGADVVSEGELLRALHAGVPAERIVYSGVAKTEREINLALEAGILQFNVESLNELQRINSLALAAGTKARIAIRINPDVDAKTHEKISTGKAENKFGIPISQAPEIYQAAAEMPGLIIQGIAMHIGSQLIDLQPYREAYQLLYKLVKQLRNAGHPVSHLDIGGGLGIAYKPSDPAPSVADYCAEVKQLLKSWDGKIIIEPGRSLVAECGLLISSVIYIKQGQARNFCILDAAMNDLLRPSLYGQEHHTIPEALTETISTYDLVGPVCETGDTFARNYKMQEVKEGDLVAFTCVGAYGAVMSSNYNSRLNAPEILVNGDQFRVIRARKSFEQLLADDTLPDWQ
ncbi:MAG: diaminopimelate decarboxylase [Enterobacterales bacterium]|nr:diaminopimelate decarboxylase [Enterobacterales bacterium]